MRIHVVHGPWSEANTRAFFGPILRCRRELKHCGLRVAFFPRLEEPALACDVLLLDDKYFGYAWNDQRGRILERLEQLQAAGHRIIYCDLGDSSGLLRVDALVRTTAYWKGFLLRDRRHYTEAHYGGRIYTAYFHETAQVSDESPLSSQPVAAEHLGKLQLAWNYGLMPYGLTAGYGAALFQRLRAPVLLDLPAGFAKPTAPRPVPLSCRMNFRYARATIAHQRQRLKSILSESIPKTRVSRRAFFAELEGSRLVVSPFGWGEFAYRDYEAFVAGSALVKPSMAHLETYPDYYQEGRTYLPVRWDLADLTETLETALDRPRDTQEIASRAQNLYKYHLSATAGRQDFALRFKALLG